MRKPLWLIPVLLLFVAIGAPNARADSFTYSYSDSHDGFSWTTAPISGVTALTVVPAADLTATFTTGPTFGCVITFVLLDTGGGVDPSGGTTTEFAPSCGIRGAADMFALSDYTTPGGYFGFQYQDGNVNSMVVTAVTGTGSQVPEPSSFALMLAGIGVLLVTRKRWVSGLPQAC